MHTPSKCYRSFLCMLCTCTYPIFRRPEVLASVENYIENEHNQECDIVSCQSSQCAELSTVNNIEPGREEKYSGHRVTHYLGHQNKHALAGQ